MIDISYRKIIKKLFSLLSNRRKNIILIFFILSIIGAFTEVASISLIIPFVDTLIDPSKIIEYLEKLNVNIDLSNENTNSLVLLITLSFITIILISSFIKFCLGYLGHLISNNITHEMNLRMFGNLIHSDSILEQKSDENIVNSSIIKMHSVTVLIQQILSILSNFLILLFITIFLINILENFIILAIIVFGIIYFILINIFKKILSLNSKNLSESYEQRTNLLNNSLGLFKLIKVNSLEDFFLNKFTKEDYRIAKSQTINSILITSPGILIIAFTIVTFTLLIYFLKINGVDLINKLPIFAALAFSIQKVVPLMQNIYGSNAKFRANYFQSISVLNLISNKKYKKNKNSGIKKIIKRIRYNNINFSYKKKVILKNLNLELYKGDRILISGKSGSGKTTLVNILLGILEPRKGKVKIDNKLFLYKDFRKLRNLYSYTPQDNFLFNGTFNENISLNSDAKKINFNKIIDVSKYSEIFNFINKSKNKFNTVVSHAARNISGGQMQRIGIARGLYRDAEIYIFDESTNAIDKVTEINILKNFQKFYSDKILILISHKNLSKKFFNKRYQLRNNKLYKLNG